MGRTERTPGFRHTAIIVLVLAASLSGCSREQDAAPAAASPPVIEPASDAGDEPETPQLVECKARTPGCREVVDCSRRNGKSRKNCERRTVAFDVAACAARQDPAGCRQFETRFGQVTLIADASNFVSAPLSTEPVSVELITDQLKSPWDLEFLPDGSMLVTQLAGKLVQVDPAGALTDVAELDVLRVGEAGLMGLAIDPDYPRNPYIYMSYTYKLDDSDPEFAHPEMATARRIVGRISRWTYADGALADEVVLLDNIPGSVIHAGGRLEFGPDGKLYATTGDADRAMQSQDYDFLGGKVLRMNTDGSVPDDNPVPGSLVYSRGHRNPQGLAWDPVTGDLYTSEHGPTRHDEINRVAPGQNNGWGVFKCGKRMSPASPSGEPVPPVVCFDKWTMAPSGMQFVSDPDSPWFGSLFVAGLRGHHLHRFVFRDGKPAVDEIFYISDSADYAAGYAGSGRKPRVDPQTRDVEYRDGALYIINNDYTLLKLTPGPG